MKKVVIDTNVLISATYSPNSNPAEIMKSIFLDDETQLFYNQEILDEYKRVLAYEKFNFTVEQQETAIENIIEYGNELNPDKSNIPLLDESDRIFYDTAKEANAILITGNTKHFPNEDFIKKPAEYLIFIK